MRVEYANTKLERLASEPKYDYGLGPDIVKAYRKAIGYLTHCRDERDISAIKGYNFKKMGGDRSHQHSLRLNDQFRLIVQLSRDESDSVLTVIDVLDPH